MAWQPIATFSASRMVGLPTVSKRFLQRRDLAAKRQNWGEMMLLRSRKQHIRCLTSLATSTSSVALIDQALAVNPNLASAWYVSGWVRIFLGDPEHAIEHLTHAAQLSPFDPLIFHVHAGIGYALFFAGRHSDAARW